MKQLFHSLCFVTGALLGGVYLGCSNVEQDANGSTTKTRSTTQQVVEVVGDAPNTLSPFPDKSGLNDTPAAVQDDDPDPVAERSAIAAPRHVPSDVEANWLLQMIAALSAEPAE